MSKAVNIRRRPSLWSYFSFSSTPERRQSVSLPTRSGSDDPYEKPDRHNTETSHGTTGFSKQLKIAFMTQSQRSRYLKAGGIIAFIFLVLFFLAPDTNVQNYVGGE